MEEEKAAAYYVELTRKGEGAARFKQGLGFSSTSNTTGNSNDAVPIRGSALFSSSSFLSRFFRASSPSKTTELEEQAQLQTIQNKLKKKPKDNKDYGNTLSSSVSKGKTTRSRSPSREKRSSRRSRSPSRNLKRRSRSRSRDKERHLRQSKNRDAYWSKRPHRSRSRDRDKYRERERQKEKQSTKRSRSVSPLDRRPEKVGKDRAATVDYSKLIEGYENMLEKMKQKAWALDGSVLTSTRMPLWMTTRLKTRIEEQIKAAHDEAIFGAPSLLPLPPSTETVDEVEEDNGKKDISEIAPATSLISGQALAMQQGSWRDRARRSRLG